MGTTRNVAPLEGPDSLSAARGPSFGKSQLSLLRAVRCPLVSSDHGLPGKSDSHQTGSSAMPGSHGPLKNCFFLFARQGRKSVGEGYLRWLAQPEMPRTTSNGFQRVKVTAFDASRLQVTIGISQ